jgi:hypothetical protein
MKTNSRFSPELSKAKAYETVENPEFESSALG